MASILTIKDQNGNIIDIPTIRGASAYEVAVNNGFEGTEAEWLESLKGSETGFSKFDIRVVDTLPTENISNATIYLIPSLNNAIKSSLDEFEEDVYNGKGYAENTTYNHSLFEDIEKEGLCITGYIPIVGGDNFTLKNIKYNRDNTDCKIYVLAFAGAMPVMPSSDALTENYEAKWDSEGNLMSFKLPSNIGNNKYVRIQASYIGDDSGVFINATEDNLYTEYIYVDGKWEQIGGMSELLDELISDINLNTSARHEHDNSEVLAYIGENGGTFTYRGKEVYQHSKDVTLQALVGILASEGLNGVASIESPDIASSEDGIFYSLIANKIKNHTIYYSPSSSGTLTHIHPDNMESMSITVKRGNVYAFVYNKDYIGSRIMQNEADIKELEALVHGKFVTETEALSMIDDAIAKVKEDDDADIVFNSFPTEEQIRALPNNSFFTIINLDATYRKVNYWVPNGLLYINPNDENDKVYIFPVDQPEGEIYLPYYGIKTGSENAENNSIIMDKLTRKTNSYGAAYGSIFKLPAGNFYFSKPIDLVNWPFDPDDNKGHYSLKGAASTIHKNSKVGITFLHFPNLTEGQAALTVAQCSISDFVICGTLQQYHFKLWRERFDEANPDKAIEEIVNVKACGIYANGGMLINNIGFKNFYYGCYCETSNMIISDITFHHCYCGLSIGHDIKVQNLFGFDVMTLLQMRGSVSSATNVRGDSIGKHLVEILGGHSNTLVDLDCDFGMDAIVAIGDGINSSAFYNLSITGVHGRAAVRHSYKSSTTPITAEDITVDTVGEYGVIAVKNGASLNGAIIITNQGVTQNPFDKASEYLIPFILMSAGAGTTVKGVQIFSTSYTGDELTEDWVKKRVTSLSSLADACMVKIQTNIGSVIYKKDNGIVTVTDDATDIYDRMDKSALALNGEVVKTVNGIQPDIDGNVEIVEQEPEVVQSEADFVDTSKKYVLPDGYIYAYRKKFVAGTTTPDFTNQLPISLNPLTEEGTLNGVGYKEDVIYYYDENNQCMLEKSIYEPIPEESISNRWATGLIPIENGDTVRINVMGYNTTTGIPFCFILTEHDDKMYQGKLWYSGLDNITNGGGEYTSTGSYDKGLLSNVKININGELFWAIDYGPAKYIWFSILDSTPPEDVVITVNDEITYTVTEDRYEWSWTNTGENYYKPTEIPTKVGQLENDKGYITIDELLESGLGDKLIIPSYWNEELSSGAEAINKALCTSGRNKSAFLFYSDAHWNYGSQMSPTLLKYLYQHTGMTKTFFGGDIVNDEPDDDTIEDWDEMSYLWNWRNQLKDLPNHHSVPGNHDDGNNPNNRFSEEYVYGYLLAAEETPDIVRGDSELYYYIDNPAERTRYLCLDTAYKGVTENQKVFVKNALLSTLDNWHIVAISHIWYNTIYNGALREVGSINEQASELLSMFNSYNQRNGEYSGCKGKVEFCIGGHTHLDYTGVSNNIPIILVATDSQHTGGTTGDWAFEFGTNREASVNGIIADYGAGKIHVVRIGRGNSFDVNLINLPENPDIGDEATLLSISAIYTGGNVEVGTALNDLIDSISVTATYSDGSTSNITEYTLSGLIIEGSNTITVTYKGITTTFTVIGIAIESDEPVIYIDNVLFDDVEVENDLAVGYESNKRLSAHDGSINDLDGRFTSGFIPVKQGDVLYFKNIIMPNNNENYNGVFVYYDENKNKHAGSLIANIASVSDYDMKFGEDGNLKQIKITYGDPVKYIRFTATKIDESSVVTINQPISNPEPDDETTNPDNVLSISTDADGNIYNGVGYKENTRWSTSGDTETSSDGVFLSGYIPVSEGDIIKLKNVTMDKNNSNTKQCGVLFFSEMSQEYGYHEATNLINYNFAVWDDNGILTQFTIVGETIQYIRLQASYMGPDSLVTIEKPIE